MISPENRIVWSEGVEIHKDLHAPLTIWCQKIKNESGAEVKLTSGYRSIERQLQIWNAKVSGKRKILDDFDQVIDPLNLSPLDLICAILRFSALPGTSRHHWGTDFDIYDGVTQKKEEVRLVPSEWEKNGPCENLGLCINHLIDNDEMMGFYRPYSIDKGGVSPEPWHFSYAPLAQSFEKKRSKEQFIHIISGLDILLKSEILENFDLIYERFLSN